LTFFFALIWPTAFEESVVQESFSGSLLFD